ncbi:MAG: hypothetical protein PHS92_04680 [Candidatus Gracilibacteria bacterium]|nr:hypothetical protein [Candidatus Gracilibacteria bacterium]
MKTDIKNILEELYSIDSSFKDKEKEIIIILEKMALNKPDTGFDENFRIELKNKILEEISRKSIKDTKSSSMKRFIASILLGAGSIGFAAYAAFQFIPGLQFLGSNKVDFTYKEDIRSSNAFGKLTFSETSAGGQGGGLGMASDIASKGLSGESSKMMVGESKMRVSSDAMMPQFEQKIYKYVYSGTGFSVDEKEMGVLLRKKNSMRSEEVSSFLGNFKISSLDISKFGSLRLNSLNLSQDSDKGLNINIDMNEGNIYVSKNWTFWPQSKCSSEDCFRNERVKISDMPNDEKLLEIASAFISGYKIDTSSYGEPFVNKDWKDEYDRSANKDEAYVPDTVNVILPLIIDSRKVYEEYGQQKGISIGIDVKSGMVSDVNGIEKLEFEKSNYAVETDINNILKIAEKGGRFNPIAAQFAQESGNVVTIEVKIGEPELSFAHIFDYKDGKNSEYMVPALIFPVLDTPKDGEYFPKRIIVPIVKDLLSATDPGIMLR